MSHSDSPRLLVYGAYGYTGRLVVERAVAHGYEPLVAGRDRTKTRGVATAHGLQARPFAVEDAADHLGTVDVVLNCAGPFDQTADPMVDACIETETDYLDITGELQVFERIHRRGGDAEAAGVTLLPGVGFDVVPTDCLATHLHRRLPDATHLSLALESEGGVSPGTLKTMLSDIGSGGAVRRDGDLRFEQIGARTRVVDFGEGLRRAISIPWGDLSTAYHSTGIPNIDVYLSLPKNARRAFSLSRYAGGVLDADQVQRALSWLVDQYVEGPDEAARSAGEAHIWGEARSSNDRVVSRLRTPDTYRMTVRTALLVAEKVLDGEAPAGYQTPASAFGPDLVLEVPGVERVDLNGDEVVREESTAAE
ncbi:saccharopine dehydrogenase [Halobellus sp. Atlit-38R]|uniref:saccharopine dehydrogenase family protein n=1 Tax=Halobellus sp. Atlit-38R TaxID=2282131 RepID=UPI000EF24C87|nr:saccharopine dehydrogenase NADP-binding domain-containing protein [Halobellus sp. Atlit-38R]RLM89632.1 saccharopine dehydrogenase [Halobellus sp. Atlit-38R]